VSGRPTAAPASAGASAVSDWVEIIERHQQRHFHGAGYTAQGHDEDPSACCWCYESAEVAVEALAPILASLADEVRRESYQWQGGWGADGLRFAATMLDRYAQDTARKAGSDA
jgi:hypothetical protein